MGKTKLTLAAMTAAFVGTGATAASVQIDQIGAEWQNSAPAGVSINNGGDPVTIRWGNDQGEGQSGYDFSPRSPLGFTLAPDTPTVLGTFTHLNRPITGTSLDSVELDFSFGGSVLEDALGNTFPVGDVTETFGAVFDFTHDETTNTGTTAGCGGSQTSGVPCDDIVTVAAQGGASETVQVGLTQFTFTLLGFSENGVDFSDTFITTEGLDNSRDLYFDYSVNVVPLPAAGWLMIAGLGALGAVGRRRKKAA